MKIALESHGNAWIGHKCHRERIIIEFQRLIDSNSRFGSSQLTASRSIYWHPSSRCDQIQIPSYLEISKQTPKRLVRLDTLIRLEGWRQDDWFEWLPFEPSGAKATQIHLLLSSRWLENFSLPARTSVTKVMQSGRTVVANPSCTIGLIIRDPWMAPTSLSIHPSEVRMMERSSNPKRQDGSMKPSWCMNVRLAVLFSIMINSSSRRREGGETEIQVVKRLT